MKILTEAEFEQGNFLKGKRRHPVAMALMNLAVGQVLYVDAADWTWKKRSPNTLARRLERETGRTFEVLKQGGVRAWAIRRTA